MNILFYYSYPINPENGGTERVTDLVAHYLKFSGYIIYYLVREKPDKPQVKTDIQTFYLPDPTRNDSPANRLYLDQLLERLQIDVLMNQGGWNNEMYLCNHKALKANIKIVSSIHFSIDSGFKCFNELYKSEYSWSKPFLNIKTFLLRLRLPYLKKRTYKQKIAKMDFTYRHTDVIILLSQKYVSEFEMLIGVPHSDKIVAIPNPLTFSNIEVRSMQQKENCILFVGRLFYPDKRVDRLLHIWHKIQYKLPDWRLELVGDGMERTDLECLAKKLELKNVFFHGYQSPLPYYSKAKILSLVSNYEGFNMSILEGMQNGCIPIAFSSYAAITDVIVDEENGFLVEPFDLNAYADKLYKLASTPSLLERMQPFAIQAVEKYNIRKIGNKWIDLFQSLSNK